MVLLGKNVPICGLVLPVMLVRLFKNWPYDLLDLQSRLHPEIPLGSELMLHLFLRLIFLKSVVESKFPAPQVNDGRTSRFI
jgi:hypothetical protein